MLFIPERHEELAGACWSVGEARAGIDEIVAAACRDFDPLTGWPLDPQDQEPGEPQTPATALYHGAAGVVWALQHLQSVGLARIPIELGAFVAGLLARHRERSRAAGQAGVPSYLLGEAGVLLLLWKQERAQCWADALFAAVESNLDNPTLEALWGSPGTLVAALHVLDATDAGAERERWQALLRRGVDRLFASMHVACHSSRPDEALWLWTQDLYGHHIDYLGAGHGFAGNLFPVLRGARWLDPALLRCFEERTEQLLGAVALREAGRINWDPAFDAAARGWPHKPLLQDCHGAPGIICRLATTHSGRLQAMLVDAGELVWEAGPLSKGAGLCHGTAGNGFALLKLQRMTGDARWLHRARAFAMHALAQTRRHAAVRGRPRHSLWTGDLGAALLLAACLGGDDRFPTLDVF